MPFNPFRMLNMKYGAPMGRASVGEYNGRAKLHARHCGGDGYYDRGGAYWGHSRVYAVWTRGGGFCRYIEATSAADAISKVQK